ncbi:hypothetical protein OOK36_23775 [Streptomyces sp. NBC_00365]|nr:hypothetical protein [Streptomyces sp. NBC_00365]
MATLQAQAVLLPCQQSHQVFGEEGEQDRSSNITEEALPSGADDVLAGEVVRAGTAPAKADVDKAKANITAAQAEAKKQLALLKEHPDLPLTGFAIASSFCPEPGRPLHSLILRLGEHDTDGITAWARALGTEPVIDGARYRLDTALDGIGIWASATIPEADYDVDAAVLFRPPTTSASPCGACS